MKLVDRHILSCAVNFRCRGDEQAPYPTVFSGLADVERTGDVGIDITFRGNVAVRDGYQCGQMKDGVDIAGNMTAKGGIAHIAADNLKIIVSQAVEPTPVIERIILTERPDPDALRQKEFDKMRTDEAVGAGNERMFYLS